MRLFFWFALIVFLVSCSTNSEKEAATEKSLTVNFMQRSLSEALSKAKQDNKPVLVDVYAVWCAPCKELDRQVFSDEQAGEFINARLVSLKVDGEKGEGPELMKKYNIPGYPTILLLNPNGEEIDRLVGFGDKEKWMQTLKDYLEGKNTLQDLTSRLETEDDNVELHYQLARKLVYRGEEERALKHYQRVVELDAGNEHGYGNDARFQIATLQMKINEDPEPLQQFIKTSSEGRYVMQAYHDLTRFFRSQKDPNKLVATYEEAIARFPENASLMNSYAWDIFRLKLKAHYERGIEVAQKAVELEPDAAAIWDTLGQLHFEAGNVEEAIQAMQRAAELDPDDESFKENLERYKQSRMKA